MYALVMACRKITRVGCIFFTVPSRAITSEIENAAAYKPSGHIIQTTPSSSFAVYLLNLLLFYYSLYIIMDFASGDWWKTNKKNRLKTFLGHHSSISIIRKFLSIINLKRFDAPWCYNWNFWYVFGMCVVTGGKTKYQLCGYTH